MNKAIMEFVFDCNSNEFNENLAVVVEDKKGAKATCFIGDICYFNDRIMQIASISEDAITWVKVVLFYELTMLSWITGLNDLFCIEKPAEFSPEYKWLSATRRRDLDGKVLGIKFPIYQIDNTFYAVDLPE